MKENNFIFPILIIIINIYILSCANQVSPQGGPRDTIPPLIIASIPKNKSINYIDKTFKFEFNEKINTDELTSKLIITPRIENKFKVYTNKNIMVLTFEKNFKDTTTFTLNFADGVGDITENNPVKNFTFAFSTGPTIDSIYLKGNVKNLYNNENQKDILIALFDIKDTLNIFTGKPKYFTKTNEKGNYLIENIKNENYKLYAFLDDNKNLINEPASEPHGFISDTLNLNTSLDSINIKIQLIDASQPKFIRSKITGRYFDILYNKYCNKYFVKKINNTNKLNIPANHYAKKNTIIRFYKDDSFQYDTDSLELIVDFYDSLNNQLTDTVFVKFKKSNRKKSEFIMDIFPSDKTINENLELMLKFNKPINYFNKDSFILKYDTIKIINIPDSTFIWNETKTKLKIQVHLDKTYLPKEIERIKHEIALADSTKSNEKGIGIKNVIKLYIAQATFLSVDNDSSEVIKLKYNFKKEDDFGILSGKITTDKKSYFLQLTNPKFKVIKELKNVKDFNFNQVIPGKYTFRIMIDKNNNGKWSSGNILKNIEPEPIWFYSETFDIRANWKVENLNITF